MTELNLSFLHSFLIDGGVIAFFWKHFKQLIREEPNRFNIAMAHKRYALDLAPPALGFYRNLVVNQEFVDNCIMDYLPFPYYNNVPVQAAPDTTITESQPESSFIPFEILGKLVDIYYPSWAHYFGTKDFPLPANPTIMTKHFVRSEYFLEFWTMYEDPFASDSILHFQSIWADLLPHLVPRFHRIGQVKLPNGNVLNLGEYRIIIKGKRLEDMSKRFNYKGEEDRTLRIRGSVDVYSYQFCGPKPIQYVK